MSFKDKRLFISKVSSNNEILEVSSGNTNEEGKTLIVNDSLMSYIIAYYVIHKGYDVEEVAIGGENTFVEQGLIDIYVGKADTFHKTSSMINKLDESINKGYRIDRVSFVKHGSSKEIDKVYIKSNGVFGITRDVEIENLEEAFSEYFDNKDIYENLELNETVSYKPFYNEKDGNLVVSMVPSFERDTDLHYSMIQSQMRFMNKQPIAITNSIMSKMIEEYMIKRNYSLLNVEVEGVNSACKERYINNMLKLILPHEHCYDEVIMNHLSPLILADQIRSVKFVSLSNSSTVSVSPTSVSVDNNVDKELVRAVIEDMRDEYF